MAYTRWNQSGYYIFGREDDVDFDGTSISNDKVDVFIYGLFDEERNGGEEFWERFYHGKRITENFQKGFRIQKLIRYAPDLESCAADIAVLAGEIWREHYTPIIGSEQVEYMLAKFQAAEKICADIQKQGHTYLIAQNTDTGELIGYGSIVLKDDFLLLSKLYVHNNFRCKGVARSLLNEVISLCKTSYGFDKIRLTVNKQNIDAIAVYEKMGFETVDSVKTDIGGGFFMDDYVMERDLTMQTKRS
ncbi:MAG: GNAT family N-acetyltransferase [Oscillospiraceae bacterium]|nr:GNAT family N-acetyltransferase [Oscillospiraceae bacterium]